MAAYWARVRWLRRRSPGGRWTPCPWRAWVSRWMVRRLTPNHSARPVSLIPGSSPPGLGDGLPGVRRDWPGGWIRPGRQVLQIGQGRPRQGNRSPMPRSGRLRGGGHDSGVGCWWFEAPAEPIPSSRCTASLRSWRPVICRTTAATRVDVHTSLSKPCAWTLLRSASSIAGSMLSRIAAWRLGPRLRNAGVPPLRQRECQLTAVCRATPSWRATEDGGTPWANRSAARSRTACPLARCLASSLAGEAGDGLSHRAATSASPRAQS
jgi:hypothetical protein